VKTFWRLTRSWICHNHKAYYTYVLLCACLVYNVVWHGAIGYYRWNNRERSLEWAIEQERIWDEIKPKEEEYDDEDYGDEDAAEVAEVADAEADAEEEEDDE
jgi:hypothetical protein